METPKCYQLCCCYGARRKSEINRLLNRQHGIRSIWHLYATTRSTIVADVTHSIKCPDQPFINHAALRVVVGQALWRLEGVSFRIISTSFADPIPVGTIISHRSASRHESDAPSITLHELLDTLTSLRNGERRPTASAYGDLVRLASEHQFRRAMPILQGSLPAPNFPKESIGWDIAVAALDDAAKGDVSLAESDYESLMTLSPNLVSGQVSWLIARSLHTPIPPHSPSFWVDYLATCSNPNTHFHDYAA